MYNYYLFRCQIPVVLMGETGCGKTHLIRFMCKFATHGKNLKNMFILKVITVILLNNFMLFACHIGSWGHE